MTERIQRVQGEVGDKIYKVNVDIKGIASKQGEQEIKLTEIENKLVALTNDFTSLVVSK